MAAAELTETNFNLQHIMPVIIKAAKATQNDWVVVPYRGVILLGGLVASVAANAAETTTYATAAINNGGAAYTATTTSIVVGTAAITRVPPYYVLTGGGEIIEVIADSAPGVNAATWTIRRGCLGTTASATGLANTNVVHILNMLILGSATVGPDIVLVWPLPDEYSAKLFA